MSKLVPNSPNGEHCSTCYFRVEVKASADVTLHLCHGAPPSVYAVPGGRQSEFPSVNPADPNFWCGSYRLRQKQRKRT